MTTSSLPNPEINNSDEFVKGFFNRYYTKSLEFPANEVDSVVAFFKKRGFEDTSANSVATVLLEQAKIDNVKVFTLLDTLNGVNEVQLSSLVTEILNYSRSKTSTLGYRINQSTNSVEARNIAV